MRLVDPDGEQLGIKLLPEALAIARDLDLDLVEVAPGANPPVCRIMDFGKHKFDEAQRAKESRRKAVHVGIKEMKYRPKIGPGDFDTKTRQVAKFLEEGHKVKITIMFRGREVFHPELGKKILDRIAEQMEGLGKSESVPRLDGRNMVMVLAPEKRAKAGRLVHGRGGSKGGHRRHAAARRPHRTEPAPAGAAPAPERVAAAATVADRDGSGGSGRPGGGAAPGRRVERRRGIATMPKMKTDSGAKKRVKVTGIGAAAPSQGVPVAPARAQVGRAQAPARPRDGLRPRRRAADQEDARHVAAVRPRRPPPRRTAPAAATGRSPAPPRRTARPGRPTHHQTTRNRPAPHRPTTSKEFTMARVKGAVHAKKHHRAILEQAQGYYGNKSRSFRAANEQVMHSGQYAFRDRRARKGDFRQLWIQRINAAARLNGMSYSRFIAGLHRADVEVDRKVLADLAVTEPEAFASLVQVASERAGHAPATAEAGS